MREKSSRLRTTKATKKRAQLKKKKDIEKKYDIIKAWYFIHKGLI